MAQQKFQTEFSIFIVAIDCGRLQNPPFGRVELAGTVINQRATYTCIPGYVLIGNRVRICLINGRWSGETPACRLGESLSLIPHSCSLPLKFLRIRLLC